MSSKGRSWSVIGEGRIKEMYDFYLAGNSLADVGDAYDRSRQSVFELFRRYGLEIRPKRKPKPFVEFNGNKYTVRNHGYLMKTCEPRTLLHRDLWESIYGAIPEGYDIHHKDGDKQNNVIENLQCLSKADHSRMATHGQNQYTKKAKGEKCGA